MAKKAVLALIPFIFMYSDCTIMPSPRSLPTLTCEDRYSTAAYGTTFYACRSEVSPAQPGPVDISRQLNEAFELVGKVKQYAQNTMAMQETVNYREFRRGIIEPPKKSYRLYVTLPFSIALEPDKKFLSASQEYREAITNPLMLFSRADNLLDEEAYYKEKGYDTKRRELSDFSPGCNISESFMASTLERQIEMVMHEDWHYNMGYYWNTDLDEDLEESLATLMGLSSTIDFSKQEYGIESGIYEESVAALERWKMFSDFINGSYNELSELYTRDIPDEEKARLKQEIIDKRTLEFRAVNNASIMAQLPYTRLFPAAYRIYQTHPSITELANILKKTPNDEEEGIEYLENSVWFVPPADEE